MDIMGDKRRHSQLPADHEPRHWLTSAVATLDAVGWREGRPNAHSPHYGLPRGGSDSGLIIPR